MQQLDKLRQSGEKTVVFAHHRDVMDRLQQLLEDLALPYVRIDGLMGAADKCVWFFPFLFLCVCV